MRKKKYLFFGIIVLGLLIGFISAELIVGNTNTNNNIVELETDISEIYGEMWGEEIGEVLIASAGIHYGIINMTEGLNKGFSFSQGNLTAQFSGVYQVVSQMSFSDGANTEFHIGASINGVEEAKCHGARKIGTGGDVGSDSFTCLIRLNVGDRVVINIENEDSTTNPLIKFIQITLVRIGN